MLDKASSKVDFSVGVGIYMLPSDMNLRIRDSVAGYNNKILISKKGFSVGKNQRVNNNNLIVMNKTIPTVNKPTTLIVNKPTPPVVNKTITTEEEVVLGVTLAIIAAVIMVYRR